MTLYKVKWNLNNAANRQALGCLDLDLQNMTLFRPEGKQVTDINNW